MTRNSENGIKTSHVKIAKSIWHLYFFTLKINKYPPTSEREEEKSYLASDKMSMKQAVNLCENYEGE